MSEAAPITETVLREISRAANGLRATIIGQHQGFALMFRVGSADRILVTARGDIRLFASLQTAGSFMHSSGISLFTVDMQGYTPGRLRPPRPDRAEALRRTRTKLRQQPLEFTNAESRI
jgi:hypothetical protein